MIYIKDVSLTYGLQAIHCRLPAKRLIGIIGANGAGKSSLLKVIAGLKVPLCGSVYLQNNNLATMSHAKRGQYLAYLGQETPTHWQLSVRDVLALGGLPSLSSTNQQITIQQLAKQFGLQSLLDQLMATLSGGERARVHLARCLVKDAPILLADEPIAALDPYYQIDIMEKLKQLSTQKTCVVVLHHLSLAYQYCDELLLLHQGRLIDSGPAEQVIMTENLAKAFSISATINRQEKIIHSIRQLPA